MAIRINHTTESIIPDSETLILEGTGAVTVPKGLTGERSAGLPGELRFNTTTNKLETWETAWVDVVGGVNARDVFADVRDPSGIVDRADSTVAFVDGTRTFSITPTGASFDYYIHGVVYTVAAKSLVIPNVTGIYYLYLDVNGNLLSQTTFTLDLLLDQALVGAVHWNAISTLGVYVADERHGITMDGATHYHLHLVLGAQWESGLALGSFNIGSGAIDSHAQYDVSDGTFRDEDLQHDIYDTGGAVNVYDLEQQLTPVANIPILYRLGPTASNDWYIKTADSFALIYSGTAGYVGASGRPPYNRLNAGVWSLTEVGDTEYFFVHIFATNDINHPIVGVQGINTFATAPASQAAARTELGQLTGLPFDEFVPLATVTFNSANTMANIPQATIVLTDTGEDYVDWRSSESFATTVGGVGVSDHGQLSGLQDDDHLQYAVTRSGSTRVTSDVNAASIGQVLEFDGTYWKNASAAGSVSEPANRVVFGTGAGVTSNAAFTFDPTTHALTLAGGTVASPGGNISLTAAGTAGATGGGIILTAGAAATTPGTILITGGAAAVASGVAGGAVDIIGGTGEAAGSGAAVSVKAGPGGVAGAGGLLVLQGGAGSLGGGNVQLTGGASSGNATGGLFLSTTSPIVNQNSGGISLTTGAVTGAGVAGTITMNVGSTQTLQLTATRNVVLGNAALITTATSGFIHVAGMPGTPTGVPTSFAGRYPLTYDSANNKLYAYDGGWIDLTGAAGGTPPGGADTQIQYNNAGVFGGDPDFTYVAAVGTFYANTTDGTSGSLSVATPGNVALFAASASAATVAGGNLNFAAGDGGSTTGGGGVIALTAGDGGASGAGGSVSLTAGASGATTGDGGDVAITAGAAGGASGSPGVIGLNTAAGYTYQRGGNFAAPGDAQSNNYVLRTVTTNSAVATEAFLDGTGGSRRMVLPSDSTWKFEVNAVARGVAGANDNLGAAYKFEGVLDNNGGTTAIIGSLVTTLLGEDVPAWDVTVSADDGNDALIVEVTGDATSTIRWVVFVKTVEVSG